MSKYVIPLRVRAHMIYIIIVAIGVMYVAVGVAMVGNAMLIRYERTWHIQNMIFLVVSAVALFHPLLILFARWPPAQLFRAARTCIRRWIHH